MSTERTVFHSFEVDDPTLLAEGWYVGATFNGDTLCADEGCVGPYPTREDAELIAARADWRVPKLPADTITIGLYPRLLKT